jgi:hypothetical protein
VNQSSSLQLARGAITNHDEITVILIEPADGTPATCTDALAATSHNSRRHALPCCGGDDRTHHRRVRDGAGTTQGRRTMSRDFKVFLLSMGGLLAVAGFALLVLWTGLTGLTWLD